VQCRESSKHVSDVHSCDKGFQPSCVRGSKHATCQCPCESKIFKKSGTSGINRHTLACRKATSREKDKGECWKDRRATSLCNATPHCYNPPPAASAKKPVLGGEKHQV